MKELNVIQRNFKWDVLRFDSLGAFSKDYLVQVQKNLEETFSDAEIGRVQARYIAVLRRFAECQYLEGFQRKPIQEIAIEQGTSVLKSTFEEYLNALVMNPFRDLAMKSSNTEMTSLVRELSGVVHALNGEVLRDKVGACDDKTFCFILAAFRLKEVDYHFESFRDTKLEVLYSNDSISLCAASVRKPVNRFFRFFIGGDASNEEEFNPERYYGGTPVSESRILSYCRNQDIPEDISTKLMSIVKCSKRFEKTCGQDGALYSLKVQYLNNKYAMAVAILDKEGKPLHKEEIYARIQKLHDQYPNLVNNHSLASFVLRRKPILGEASAQGEWGLRTWAKKRDVLQDIRDYVSEVYAKTSQPVPLEDIENQMKALGHTYPIKTLRTYVTKSGCVGQRGNRYVPQGFAGDVRYWMGKLYLIQRQAAYFFLESCERSASRKSLQTFIQDKTKHPVNVATLNRALNARPDLFSATGTNKKNQLIVFSGQIKSKRDVPKEIPEPEKKEPEYVKIIRPKIVDYLFKHNSELQKNLTRIFIEDVPKHLKSGDSVIRKIMSDEDIFLKQNSSDGVTVSLQPTYRARMELEMPKVRDESNPVEDKVPFSWESLKAGIMKQLLKDNVDPTLSGALDNVFLIMRSGEEEMPINSNFNEVLPLLFKWVSSSTTAEERRDLQEKILTYMEAFLREFHFLKYGDRLNSVEGFGGLKYTFREMGIFPDKDREYLSKEQFQIYWTIESVNTQRNKIVGHPGALAEQSDKQSIIDIHNCLSVMVWLGKKFGQ